MHSPRPHAGLIILFLWTCPLAGTSVFVGEVVRGAALPPFYKVDSHDKFLDLPARGYLALLVIAIIVPLIVACVTHRAPGFFAAVSFVILVALIAIWIRSHYLFDDLMLCRLDEKSAVPILHEQLVHSMSGGISFCSRRVMGERMGSIARLYLLALGRDESLSYGSGAAINEYPVAYESFTETPLWLRHLGFAAGIKPKSDWNLQDGGTLFAVALPYWFICLLAAPLPVRWAIRHHRQRRALRVNPNACRNCGYDLRATPDASGAKLTICPECGTASSVISTESKT